MPIESLNVKQAKILIIDDEKLLRKGLQRILEKSGFYCDTALDYPTAKECIEKQKFDLLLVDIILPKMNGLSLISHLQEEFDLDSAIIFITGEPNYETCSEALRLGASNYLEKPVTKDDLLLSITTALARRKQELKIIKNGERLSLHLNQSDISIVIEFEKEIWKGIYRRTTHPTE